MGTALWDRLTDLCHLVTQLRCRDKKALSVKVKKLKVLSSYGILFCVGRKGIIQKLKNLPFHLAVHSYTGYIPILFIPSL